MARRSVLKASDADREQIAERLRNATAEGRLLAEELEDRLGAAFSARTYRELDAVVADLPRDRMLVAGPHRRTMVRFRSLPTLALMIVIPVALTLTAAVVLVIAMLFVAWAIVVGLAWLVLGHRARGLRGPWAVARRAGRWSRTDRRTAGGFTPWL
jgi:hypothetical protein